MHRPFVSRKKIRVNAPTAYLIHQMQSFVNLPRTDVTFGCGIIHPVYGNTVGIHCSHQREIHQSALNSSQHQTVHRIPDTHRIRIDRNVSPTAFFIILPAAFLITPVFIAPVPFPAFITPILIAPIFTVFFLTIIFIFSVISASAAHYSIIAHIIALFKKPGSLPRQNFPERCTTTAHKQYIIGSPVKQRPAAGRHHYRTILQSILVFN